MERLGPREFTAAEILEATRTTTPLITIETARDAIPGGLAMAMAPALIHWDESPFERKIDPYYLVNNVCISTNPIGGKTTLATVRVPADAVESAQYVFVASKIRRLETEGGHGMLRVVFRADRRPLVLTNEGHPLALGAHLDDLIFSWEAWRPPMIEFDAVAGLDPSTYALTMRCYAGPVRCLSDAIFDRPWHCYPLRFPDVPRALDVLLYESLLLGDAVGRQTIGSLLDERIEQRRGTPDGYAEVEAELWRELIRQLAKESVPESPVDELLGGNISYHLLERSCITMALATIDAANVRIHAIGRRGQPRRVRFAPRRLPEFFDRLARGDRTRALLGVMGAFHWLMQNQTVIPGKAHHLLDEAGLIEHDEDGKPIRLHYDLRKETPYGRPQDNLIF